MKEKSLRQLAKELGVSHSYLSQVKNGKRPASKKLVSMVSSVPIQNADFKSVEGHVMSQVGSTPIRSRHPFNVINPKS